MSLRLPRSGVCLNCNHNVIEGMKGLRLRLCIPAPLEVLYNCTKSHAGHIIA